MAGSSLLVVDTESMWIETGSDEGDGLECLFPI